MTWLSEGEVVEKGRASVNEKRDIRYFQLKNIISFIEPTVHRNPIPGWSKCFEILVVK